MHIPDGFLNTGMSVVTGVAAAGAVGVAAAHSGTLLALLFDPRRAAAAAARPRLEQRLGLPLEPARVVGGGVRWVEASAGALPEGRRAAEAPADRERRRLPPDDGSRDRP